MAMTRTLDIGPMYFKAGDALRKGVACAELGDVEVRAEVRILNEPRLILSTRILVHVGRFHGSLWDAAVDATAARVELRLREGTTRLANGAQVTAAVLPSCVIREIIAPHHDFAHAEMEYLCDGRDAEFTTAPAGMLAFVAPESSRLSD